MSEPKQSEATFTASSKNNFPTFRRLLARPRRFLHLIASWFWRNRRRFVGALLTLTALWVVTNIYATVMLNRELAAIKQRGEPVTFAESSPEIPDEENAALVYKKAYKLLRYEEHENPSMLGLAYDASDMTPQYAFAARERIFSRNRATSELIFQATQMPEYRVEIDSSEPSSLQQGMEHNGHMREFARFMSAQADHEAKRGRHEQAFRCIAAIYRMSEHVAQTPTVMSMLVAVAMEHIGHAALARVLDVTSLSANEAKNLVDLLPSNNWSGTLRRAWQNDRLLILPIFKVLVFRRKEMTLTTM